MNSKLENALRTILDYVQNNLDGTSLSGEVNDAAEIVETYLNSFDL